MTNSWKAIKSQLGEIQFLDLTRFDLVNAHYELGRQVKESVWMTFELRAREIAPERIARRADQAKACGDVLQEHIESEGIPEELRAALREYNSCLEAWSDGLELGRLSQSNLYLEIFGGKHLSPSEMALFLQHDNVGCQTGMYRLASGGVSLWHTEEDVDPASGSRFDKLRVAIFQVGNNQKQILMNAFIYPDLMPGPAFSWRSDGYVQTVDTLLLRNPPRLAGGLLANIVSWLALRLGLSINPLDMLESLQPFIDGYALNQIWHEDHKVYSARHEFAGNRLVKSILSEQPDTYLFQVNYFSDRSDAGLLEMESLPSRMIAVMKKRVERTKKALHDQKADFSQIETAQKTFFRLITSRTGRSWAYANKDVKGYFICQAQPEELEIWLGAGPADRDEVPLKFFQKVN